MRDRYKHNFSKPIVISNTSNFFYTDYIDNGSISLTVNDSGTGLSQVVGMSGSYIIVEDLISTGNISNEVENVLVNNPNIIEQLIIDNPTIFDGIAGTSGTSGTSGINGVAGTSGTSGTSGKNGTNGVAGTSGTTGTSGTSGNNGANGTSGTSGHTHSNKSLLDSINQNLATNSTVNFGQVTSSGGLVYTKSLDVSYQNLNDITNAGFYNGINMTNAPTNGWFYIEVERHSGNDLWVKQTITSFAQGVSSNLTHIRLRENGVWSTWRTVITDDVGNEKYIPRGGTTLELPAYGTLNTSEYWTIKNPSQSNFNFQLTKAEVYGPSMVNIVSNNSYVRLADGYVTIYGANTNLCVLKGSMYYPNEKYIPEAYAQIGDVHKQRDVVQSRNLTSSDMGAILKIKANVTLNIPPGLPTNFNIVARTYTGCTLTITNSAGVSLDADGTTLGPRKFMTLYKDGSSETFVIIGDVS